MINYHTLLEQMTDPALQCWRDQLSGQIDQALSRQRWGDLPDWLAAVEGLPNITASDYDLSQGKIRIGRPADCDDAARAIIQARLMTLHPWRKGPFDLFGIHIDTEWRSDWKWARLAPHIQNLTGRRVLDVGCGNGYYMLRMLGQQARLVIGLDPGVKYIVQWQALRHFLGDLPGYALPLGIESLPDGLQAFDTVFSMGVLYHRRTPLEHLIQLKGALKPGGELILETLVVPDEYGHTLTPQGRYAKMRNVWCIPSIPILEQWLEKAGYSGVRTVNVSITTPEEQRSTQWMRFESLTDFLDPDNPSKTIEGYPAPARAMVVAQA